MLGLIYANARLYDPLLGRFLSPDPYVQDPDFTQNYNRYSYCLNNPLKYTDESGELIGIDDVLLAMMMGSVFGMISGALLANEMGAQSFSDYIPYLLAGATIGASASLFGLTAGSFITNISSLGGFAGGTLSGAASGATSGFIYGFSSTMMQTGNPVQSLHNGFSSGGKASISSGLIGGITGGIHSKRNGGSFWSGIGETIDYVYDPREYNEGLAPLEYSQQTVSDFSDKNFGPRPDWHLLKADGSLPKDYYSNENGEVFNRSGERVYGVSQRIGGSRYTTYIFKDACSSKQQLYLTLGHEYYHVALWRIGIPSDEHHYFISQWQMNQSVVWDFEVNKNILFYNTNHSDPYLGYGDYFYLGLDGLIMILNRWHYL